MKKINIIVIAALFLIAVSSMVMAKSSNFDVKINVPPFANVGTPGDLTINLFDSTQNNTISSSFTIRTNYGINLDITSSRFPTYTDGRNSIDLNKYIDYGINTSDDPDIEPGTTVTNVLTVKEAHSNTAIFYVELDEEGLLADNWHLIPEGETPTSTVTLTISAQ